MLEQSRRPHLDAVAGCQCGWELAQAVVRRVELLERRRHALEGGGEEEGSGEGGHVVLGQVEHLLVYNEGGMGVWEGEYRKK